MLRQAMAMRSDGMIGEEALSNCATALRHLKNMAEAFGATAHVAIATAVFRDASDGEAFLESVVREDIGIDAQIISQDF